MTELRALSARWLGAGRAARLGASRGGTVATMLALALALGGAGAEVARAQTASPSAPTAAPTATPTAAPTRPAPPSSVAGEHAPAACELPDDLLDAERMPRLAQRLERGQPVVIVVLGSGSSAGASMSRGAPAYPALLQARLAHRFPRAPIEVRTIAQRGATAAQMLQRLSSEVMALRPSLVVWQTGSTDAMRGVPPDQFAQSLDRGLSLLAERRVDAVLVDMQYAPYSDTFANLGRYRSAMRWMAQRYDVTLFSRYEAMEHWGSHGLFDPLASDREQQVRNAATIHECLALALARLIDAGVRDEQGRYRTSP